MALSADCLLLRAKDKRLFGTLHITNFDNFKSSVSSIVIGDINCIRNASDDVSADADFLN